MPPLRSSHGKVIVVSTGSMSVLPDPRFHVFLLFGQSNMEGSPRPAPEDQIVDPRIQVLAYDNQPELGRTYNAWYDAKPPLHAMHGGLGPGDYFAKSLLSQLEEGHAIGLVPCAIGGVDIDYFRKGVTSSRRSEFRIPPDNERASAYDFLIERGRLAMKRGRLRGLLFHQGESDLGRPEWLDKVAGIVKDARQDLGAPTVPFVAAELYRQGKCAAHNALVAQLPSRIEHCAVVSAEGLSGEDDYHFDAASQRELGRRYAKAWLRLAGIL